MIYFLWSSWSLTNLGKCEKKNIATVHIKIIARLHSLVCWFARLSRLFAISFSEMLKYSRCLGKPFSFIGPCCWLISIETLVIGEVLRTLKCVLMYLTGSSLTWPMMSLLSQNSSYWDCVVIFVWQSRFSSWEQGECKME